MAKKQTRAIEALEIEQKFEVPPDFELPDLTELPDVSGVGEPRRFTLTATYLDAPDLRLLRRGVTLRRRTGGDDAGWHLKRPEAHETASGVQQRSELRLPPGRSVTRVPGVLTDQVTVWMREAPLEPVVRLRTKRLETPVLDTSGIEIATIAHDQVECAPLIDGSVATSNWCELEVELAEGTDPAVLEAITETLLEAGADPSVTANKLARGLGDRLAELPESYGPGGLPAIPPVVDDGAGMFVLAYMRESVQALHDHDPLVRDDAPDAVHKMRVATRRLRSALRTFRPLFDRGFTDPLRDELKWLGQVLGAARDAEVTGAQLLALIADEPDDLVIGPVGERVRTQIDKTYAAAHKDLVAELDGPRYFALLDALDLLIGNPPLTNQAVGDPDTVLLPLARKCWKRVRRMHRADVANVKQGRTAPAERDEALHELRKAAKRARYAGEALAPLHSSAADWAEAMTLIQDTLGDHQDTVVTREAIRSIAGTAHRVREQTFTYGRLHAHEEARGVATLRAYDKAYAQASAKKLRRWMRS